MLALLQHPHSMNRLRDDPAMIKTAIEELLRYTSPVFMSTERYSREDLNIQGVTIPRGEMTLGVIGSANRDETVFDDPDELNINRDVTPLGWSDGPIRFKT
jgi:cytochrome P450 PksS